MKIDLNKLTPEDFNVLFDNNPDALRAALEAVTPNLDFDLWQLTIKDLGDFINNKTPDKVVKILTNDNNTAVDLLQKQKALELFFDNFTKLLTSFTVNPTPDDIRASRNLPKFNETEGLLVFARRYFGLKSFSEAEDVTLADLFLAKKDEYIGAMFQRNMFNNKKTNK